MDNTKEYIVCAAIIYESSIERYRANKIINLFDFEIGHRHLDIILRNNGCKDRPVIDTERRINKSPDAQGFMTSTSRFVSREEAYEIALECGQITEETKCIKGSKQLFSEDIY